MPRRHSLSRLKQDGHDQGVGKPDFDTVHETISGTCKLAGDQAGVNQPSSSSFLQPWQTMYTFRPLRRTFDNGQNVMVGWILHNLVQCSLHLSV